jgi:hypothetical protein
MHNNLRDLALGGLWEICEQWNPTSLQEVTPEDVKLVFQPFKENLELQLQDPRFVQKAGQISDHMDYISFIF